MQIATYELNLKEQFYFLEKSSMILEGKTHTKFAKNRLWSNACDFGIRGFVAKFQSMKILCCWHCVHQAATFPIKFTFFVSFSIFWLVMTSYLVVMTSLIADVMTSSFFLLWLLRTLEKKASTIFLQKLFFQFFLFFHTFPLISAVVICSFLCFLFSSLFIFSSFLVYLLFSSFLVFSCYFIYFFHRWGDRGSFWWCHFHVTGNQNCFYVAWIQLGKHFGN